MPPPIVDAFEVIDIACQNRHGVKALVAQPLALAASRDASCDGVTVGRVATVENLTYVCAAADTGNRWRVVGG